MKCRHCEGVLLEKTVDVSIPGALENEVFLPYQNGTGSVIVTGGKDLDGVLPVENYIDGIARASKLGVKVVVRPGLASDDMVNRLKDAGASAFSFEIHQDQEIVTYVLGLQRTVEDYVHVLDSMIATGVPVIPRIALGFGRIDFELSVGLLKSKGLKHVVLDTVVPDDRTCIDESVVTSEIYLECAKYLMERGFEVCLGSRIDPSMENIHIRAAETGIRNFEEISPKATEALENAGYGYSLHSCHFGLE